MEARRRLDVSQGQARPNTLLGGAFEDVASPLRLGHHDIMTPRCFSRVSPMHDIMTFKYTDMFEVLSCNWTRNYYKNVDVCVGTVPCTPAEHKNEIPCATLYTNPAHTRLTLLTAAPNGGSMSILHAIAMHHTLNYLMFQSIPLVALFLIFCLQCASTAPTCTTYFAPKGTAHRLSLSLHDTLNL